MVGGVIMAVAIAVPGRVLAIGYTAPQKDVVEFLRHLNYS